MNFSGRSESQYQGEQNNLSVLGLPPKGQSILTDQTSQSQSTNTLMSATSQLPLTPFHGIELLTPSTTTYNKWTQDDCLHMVSESIQAILQNTFNDEFRKQCYDLLKVSSSGEARNRIQTLLEQSSQSEIQVQPTGQQATPLLVPTPPCQDSDLFLSTTNVGSVSPIVTPGTPGGSGSLLGESTPAIPFTGSVADLNSEFGMEDQAIQLSDASVNNSENFHVTLSGNESLEAGVENEHRSDLNCSFEHEIPPASPSLLNGEESFGIAVTNINIVPFSFDEEPIRFQEQSEQSHLLENETRYGRTSRKISQAIDDIENQTTSDHSEGINSQILQISSQNGSGLPSLIEKDWYNGGSQNMVHLQSSQSQSPRLPGSAAKGPLQEIQNTSTPNSTSSLSQITRESLLNSLRSFN